LLQRIYHLHIFHAHARQAKKKTSTSFDLQKASLSYDCSDISAICVEEVLLQAKLFDAGLPGLSDVGLWKGANHLHDN